MPSNSLDDLTPDTRRVANKFIELARARGIEVQVTSTLRTCEEQNAIYAQGRTEPGPVISGASGCRSWHTWGRAFDVLIKDDSQPNGLVMDGMDHRYDELGDIGKQLGMRWGGDFSWGRDAGHFEYHPGLEIDDVCPDEDPEACNRQIQQHNARYNPPVDPSAEPVVVFEQTKQGFGWSQVVLSAFVGAVVFQTVAIAVQKWNGKKP
jgi:peptidoglycan L-alanyl-D-glutamate endopeptidase CwlK